MKKQLIFLCFILLILCSGCGIFKEKYIDIAELYNNNNYNYSIIDELNDNFSNKNNPTIIYDLVLLEKENLTSYQYDVLKNELGVNFINLIFVKKKLIGDNAYEYDLAAIECESIDDIQIYYDNLEIPFYYKVKNNICYFNVSGICLLLEECIEEGNLLYNGNKKTLLRGKNLNDVFQIPEGVKKINHFAFGNNVKITKLICDESLEYIGWGAFQCVSSLKHIEFNKKIEIIESSSFHGCQLEYVIIPNSVKYIGSGAFNNGNIFCEVSSKPSKWKIDFAVENAKVYWAGQWGYDDNGIPTVINNE